MSSDVFQFRAVIVDNIEKSREFLEFPVKLYQNEKKWIRPLDAELESLYNKYKNKYLADGEAERWILLNQANEVVGRVGAFYQHKSTSRDEQLAGGIGLFECIDNQDAANVLFDTAKQWLEKAGFHLMDGPINPGMRDSFWGCLTDGFHDPVYNMPFNFPYYQSLFENYGFRNYFNQYTYQRELQGGGKLHPVIRRTAERILSNKDYEFKFIEKGNKQFAIDFRIIYNKAWVDFADTKMLTDYDALLLLKEMEPIMDERLVIYGYYKGEPIGFFIMMPDIGQIMREFNGRWNWFNKLQFLWLLKMSNRVDRVIGRIFGVVPEHQGKGVEGALVLFFENEVRKASFPYKTLELNWIGDFNPVMMKVSEYIGGRIYKTHATYRYLFDREAEFQRAPVVNLPGRSNGAK